MKLPWYFKSKGKPYLKNGKYYQDFTINKFWVIWKILINKIKLHYDKRRHI